MLPRKLSALVAFLVTLGTLTPGASAVSGIVGHDALSTWQADGRVNAIVRAGSRVYIGGRFSTLFDHSGDSVSRSHLAALSADAGTPLGFTPNVNGEVNALAVSPDGARLYVGGSFTSVNGNPRQGVAAFNVSTGALLPFQASISGGPVNALAVNATRVFVGGNFRSVDGQARRRLAALAPVSGDLQAWYPGLTDGGPVKALTLATSTRLVVGGGFMQLGGTPQAFLGAVDPDTGDVPAWNSHPTKPVITLTSSGGAVFAGTMRNEANRYDPSSGVRRWTKSGDGDVQAMAVLDGTLYIGGHFNTFAGRSEPHVAAMTASSGGFVDWTARVNSRLGVFAMWADGGLYLGGDFTKVSGGSQARIAFMQ
jgi:hypothetical protein